jgi:hypothetical protein
MAVNVLIARLNFLSNELLGFKIFVPLASVQVQAHCCSVSYLYAVCLLFVRDCFRQLVKPPYATTLSEFSHPHALLSAVCAFVCVIHTDQVDVVIFVRRNRRKFVNYQMDYSDNQNNEINEQKADNGHDDVDIDASH